MSAADMTIYGLPPIRRDEGTRRSRPGAGCAFARALGPETSNDPVTVAQPPPPLHSLLGLQEIDAGPPVALSRTGLKEASEDLLSTLVHLQRSLLSGTDPAATLGDLTRQLEALPPPSDDAQAGLISLLRLRVAVELARHSPKGAL
ncbi:hypothetical protein FHR90_001729 [Endobacter medicaginis]|uniref:Class II flagellar assembly regulator n=2 Tax=Endobacter medicaginis TaxID=1181271 RepID=A0A839UVR0_9PROT|nr:hypothetical protein [Endobacter medicaginis]MCX5475982.1 hypothetical protein [Endobacter medicaginis]NVN29297.1 hypothetical protein [Endobacter medicaginis]